MNSNHPALISGGLFFVIGLALAAALFTGLLPHCWHNMPNILMRIKKYMIMKAGMKK